MQPPLYGRSAVSSGRGQQGTLAQLADGRWQARYREPDGRRPQKTFVKRRDASDWLRDRIDDVEAIRDGDTALLVRRREAGLTVREAIERYKSAHDASAARKRVLAEQLRVAERAFGARPLQSLETYDLEAWRLTISAGYRSDVFRGFKQVLKAAVRWQWIERNPADGIPNPNRRRPEIQPFTWETVQLVSDEIEKRYEAVPILAAGTGLRPEEWIALERGDVDLAGRVIHVRRVYSSSVLCELGADGAKTWRQRRRVPLRQVVVDALAQMIPRIDTPVLFGPQRQTKHGYINLDSWRRDVWRPALRAAGLPLQRIYDLRHTYAAESIAAGIGLFELSRFMGTSMAEIDKTYGHLVGDSEERGRLLLDAYDAARMTAEEAGR
jgi:integrase